MIVILTEQIKTLNAQDIFHFNVYNFVTFHYTQLGFFIEREILLRKIDWTESDWTDFKLTLEISYFSIISLQKMRF